MFPAFQPGCQTTCKKRIEKNELVILEAQQTIAKAVRGKRRLQKKAERPAGSARRGNKKIQRGTFDKLL